MEWQQLEYFQAVASLQHMTLAAERLKLSQPALSRSIARLETELGVPLFERRGRSIVLNRYGERFLVHASHILQEYEESKREIQDLISPDTGEISLGFLHTLGASSIPDLIKGFCRTRPSITFKLHQNSTQELIHQLIAGEIDLCMSSCPEDNPQIKWTHLWSEELYVIVPVDHRLASAKIIPLKEIADEPIISFKKGYGIRKRADDLFEEAGINPTMTFEGEEVHTVIGLVSSGLGVALIPDSKGIDRKKIAVLQVSAPVCQRMIGISSIKGRYLSPAAVGFEQFVIHHYAKSTRL